LKTQFYFIQMERLPIHDLLRVTGKIMNHHLLKKQKNSYQLIHNLN